jgi:CRISPR-associated protein Csd1
MYSELVALGHTLEGENKLPPAGFASYGEPIKWLIHLWPDRAVLESVAIQLPRPFSGRTSGIEAHLLADEAGYVLGIETKDDGSSDNRASAKHLEEFRPLLQAFLQSSALVSQPLREVIGWLECAVEEGWLANDPRLGDVRSKDWVSAMPEVGPLANSHLYMHSESRAFWALEMQRRCSQGDEGAESTDAALGACAVCGKGQPLVRKLPLKVKLAAATPLHSLNLSAFTSYLGGPAPEKRTHLGLCFNCGELSARAFNYLGESDQNRVQIVRHPQSRDSLTNQYALYWLKAPGPMMAGEQEIDLFEVAMNLVPLAADGLEQAEESTIQQMADLLKVPWSPKSSGVQLSEYGFYLAILSPNVGRIAMREWLPLSINSLKASLDRWLTDTRMVNPYRDGREGPASVATMVAALGQVNADVTRALIRTAYGQSRPPEGLLFLAGKRLNTLNALEQSLRDRGGGRGRFWDNDWPHALAAAIRLVRQRQGREGYVETVNTGLNSMAYHCGRLLAVLEEAQQVYTYNQMGKRLDVSIVQRGYGGASTTPSTVLGRMFRLANSVHLPSAGRFLNEEVESIAATIATIGEMPRRLTSEQQADFGLGFYQERARIRQYRKERAAAGEAANNGVEA